VGNEVMGANQPRQAVIDDFLRSIGMAPGFTSAAAQSQTAGTGALTSMLKLPLAAVGK
jgi:hypothetical protein